MSAIEHFDVTDFPAKSTTGSDDPAHFPEGWPKPETLPAAHVLAKDHAPAIVAGLFEAGDKVVIGGGSKTFKTWTFIDLGLSVAHGVPWWDLATAKGRVLYLNFELKRANFWRRVKRVLEARELADTTDFVAWNLRGRSFSLDAHGSLLIDEVSKGGFSLVVLDPIYKLYGKRNENSAGDMAELMCLIDRIAAETGAAVLFGAHFAKGNQAGKESMDRISGSGVFARDPDCILTLTRLKDTEGSDTFSVETTVRDFPPVAPFGVCFDYPIMRQVDGVNLGNLKEPGKGGKWSVDDMLAQLRDEPLSTSEWQVRCKDELGMPRSTFYEYAPMAKKRAQEFQGKWSLPLH